MKTVGFTIKIPLAKETVASRKSLGDWRKEFADLEKKQIPALHKKTKEYLKTTQEELKKTEEHSRKLGHTFSSSMNEGLRRVSEFNEKLHKTRERVFGLKEAFEATLVGGAVFWAGEKLLEGGRNEMRTRKKIKREFGAEAGDISEIAERLARQSGLEGADAANALIPLARTLRDEVQAGAQFRGIRGKLSESQAAGLRKKNLDFGASLVKRLSILAPEVAPDELGRVLNDALTGPEGVRSLISTFNLSKRSKKLSATNEKGDVFSELSPEERKRFGITKKGQFLEQGDEVALMLERSGFTAKAAEDEMKTLDFQIKSIGNSMKTVFGEIGEAMFGKFSGEMGKGSTAAERFGAFIDAHKADIKRIGEDLGSAAEAVGHLATRLPAVGEFLSTHKTLLLSLGAGFVGFKSLAGLGGMLEKASHVPGLGGLAKGGAAVPVYVTNWNGGGGSPVPGASKPGTGTSAATWIAETAAAGGAGAGLLLAAAMAAAGIGGGLAGNYLDKHSKTANKFYAAEAGLLDDLFGGNYKKLEQSEVDRQVAALKAADERRKARIKELEAKGVAPGVALYLAEHRYEEQQGKNQTINLVVDGRVIASVVSGHLTREIKNKTANGAAPTHSE